MFDVGELLPEPVAWDDPGFDGFLAEVTAVWAEAPEAVPLKEDLAFLGSLPMGPDAAVTMASLEGFRLNGRDRLTALKERVRVHSHFQALIYEDMAAIADACENTVDPQLAWEAASSEIRAALRLTRRSADHELDTALALRDRIPMVLTALKAGDIDLRRAATIVRGTSHLPIEIARLVAAEILESAGRMTTGQLRERIRKLAIDTNPDDADERYQHATEQRRVVSEATDDGTGNIFILDVPPDRMSTARRYVDRIARSLRSPEESRTMDQLRADIAVDLLCGEEPSTHGQSPGGGHRQAGGSVNLTVDLATLAQLDDRSGHIDGFGPVIADIARKVAAAQRRSTWDFTVTDPKGGRPVATGVTRRRPDAELYRTVTANYQTCVFPGCRAEATDCDIDHRTPWTNLGGTSEENLAPLCRPDHRLKHEHGWKVARREDGEHEWTSPLGHLYTTSGRSP